MQGTKDNQITYFCYMHYYCTCIIIIKGVMQKIKHNAKIAYNVIWSSTHQES